MTRISFLSAKAPAMYVPALSAFLAWNQAAKSEALDVTCQTILDLPSPVLLVYPRETVVAENLEAIVKLGMVNSFGGGLLTAAVEATFIRRGTGLPKEVFSNVN